MKRKITILLLVLTLALGLGACTQGNGEKADIIVEETKPEEKAKTIKISDDINLDAYNLVSDFSYDFDEDGSVKLYTDAELDEDGQPILDDGQNWLLLANTKDGSFKLFDDYIQLGKIDFNGFTIDDHFYVTVKITGSANIQFDEFKYDKENKVFVQTEKYSEDENVNMIF